MTSDYALGQAQDDRAVAHRDAALAALAGVKPSTPQESVGVALVHAILALEARVEELSVWLPR